MTPLRYRHGLRRLTHRSKTNCTWSGRPFEISRTTCSKKPAPPRGRRHDPVTGAAYPWLVASTAIVNHIYFYAPDDDFRPFF